jgi:hypothetical protein
MSVLTNSGSEYFAWRHHHPHESENMSAVWGEMTRARTQELAALATGA